MSYMRISNSNLQLLIDNEGEMPFGPINTMGILRLALDLRDERNRTEQLQEEIRKLEKIVLLDSTTNSQLMFY